MKIGYCESCPVLTNVDEATNKPIPEIHVDPKTKKDHKTLVLVTDETKDPIQETEHPMKYIVRMLEKYTKRKAT